MRQLRDVLMCAFTVALFLGGIVALDSLTGVPLSYGVPLSAVISLLPYAFMLRRAGAPRASASRRRRRQQQGAAGDAAGPRRADEGRRRATRATAGSQRPAAIHSVVFLR